ELLGEFVGDVCLVGVVGAVARPMLRHAQCLHGSVDPHKKRPPRCASSQLVILTYGLRAEDNTSIAPQLAPTTLRRSEGVPGRRDVQQSRVCPRAGSR